MTEDGVTDDLVDSNGVVAEEEVTDGEFPGVGGNDGNGSDDEATEGEDPAVCGSDGNGSVDEDGVGSCSGAVVARLNLSTKTLSLSNPKARNSENQSQRRLSIFSRFLFFFNLSQYFFTGLLNFLGSHCIPVIDSNVC